ncbi:MAG: ABC transporter permease [Pseudomonadota bacterium]
MSTFPGTQSAEITTEEFLRPSIFAQLKPALRSAPVRIILVILAAIVFIACFAPFLGTVDPTIVDPGQRLLPPSAENWLGTDAFGRDIYSRVMYGARVSLIVGLGAAVASVTLGLLFGVIAGYFRMADAIIMRVMDGLMAIPGILLAIALVSLSGAGLFTVLIAITIPDIPRVVRLVRSVILSVRSEPYVEAAISLGTPLPALLMRHMVPNTVAPLIVQGTYVFASAILTESILSFLGAGLPPAIPSWGNIMADGRMYFQMIPGLIFYAGIFVALTVLSVNVLGDAMRDAMDPRMARKL